MNKELLHYYRSIPQEIVDGLARYVFEGLRPGGFLQAVLANDLAGALRRAINQNLEQITALMVLLANEVPEPAHGSVEAVAAWRALEAAERERVSGWCKVLATLWSRGGGA